MARHDGVATGNRQRRKQQTVTTQEFQVNTESVLTRLSTDLDGFRETFGIAGAVVPARTPKPILQSVLLEIRGGQGYLTATNLDLWVTVEFDAESSPSSRMLLPFDRVNKILQESPRGNAICLTIGEEGDKSVINVGRSVFTMPTQNVDEFPSNTVTVDEFATVLTANDLCQAIGLVNHAISKGMGTNQVLDGALFIHDKDSLQLVAIDGRRMAEATVAAGAISVGKEAAKDIVVPGPKHRPVVPANALKVATRLFSPLDDDPVSVGYTKSQIIFKGGGIRLSARLLEGNFPRFNEIARQETFKGEAHTTAGWLASAVGMASTMVDVESRAVRFLFSIKDGLSISATSWASGNAEVPTNIPCNHDEELFLDHSIVTQALRSLPNDQEITLRHGHSCQMTQIVTPFFRATLSPIVLE